MIHPPKRITSHEGLGIGTTKSLHFLSDTLAIGTEKWNKLSEPWQESGTIIANPGFMWRTRWEVGRPFIITKMFTDKEELAGIYCDIVRPVQRDKSGFIFEDLYLDVWQTPSISPILLDEDELAMAITVGHVTKDEATNAHAVALYLQQELQIPTSSLLNF